MIKIVHPVAGGLALLTIATFWLTTALSELFGSPEVVTAVKIAIPWGFLLLILPSRQQEDRAFPSPKGDGRS